MGRAHEVDLFTLSEDASDSGHQAELLKHCRKVTVAAVNPLLGRIRAVPYLLTQTPLTVPCFRSAELHRKVRSALATQSYDRIFVYSSSMAQYVEQVEGIPILMDLVDVDSNKWWQYAGFSCFPFSAVYRREARCLRNAEREICEKAACVVVTTHREAALVREIASRANVHVVPNVVDTEYFHPSRVGPDPRPPVLIFTGDMSYFPNEEAVSFFARKVLPLVRRSVPEARFMIVGRNPGRGVQRLRSMPGVEVTGFVPDVRTYLAGAAIAVAPFSIAAGIQNKILEAMASGLPVVGTSRAAQGLIPSVAAGVEIGDSEFELAERVVALLRDPALMRRKGLDCRERVASSYNWDDALNQLLQLVQSPAGQSGRVAV
jgi:sugar transferase (PEP-CTERM/EpsH1 system associated)